MKKLLIITSLFILLSFAAEKTYTVHYTLPQWEAKLVVLENAKQLLMKSDLQAKIVLPIVDSLSLMQSDIRNQVVPQLDTTKKK